MGAETDRKKALRDVDAQLGQLLAAHSLDPSLASAWAVLLLAPGPQSVEQIAAQLGVKPARARQALQELVALGAAVQAGAGYLVEADPLKIAVRFIRDRELPALEETEETLRYAGDLLRRAGGDSAAGQARLEELARQAGLIRKLLALLVDGERLELDRLLGLVARG